MEGLWLVSFYDYLLGRLKKSLAGYLSLKKIIESHDSGQLTSGLDWISGFIYCDLGRFEEARKALLARYEYYRQGDPARQNVIAAVYAFDLGWADLKQGHLEDARARLEEMKPLLPTLNQEDLNDVTFFYQLLDAEVALAGRSPEEAVAAAEKLHLMDFPGMGTSGIASYNTPFCKDVLARAYWKKGELDKAVAEYRRIMTVDPANKIRYLIHPLYHYRLGQILEEKGEKPGAADEFRKFLELWKDADKTHPELADAQKRLAALGSNSR
jgi:tetratricopeptide (TPR) repeat protein